MKITHPKDFLVKMNDAEYKRFRTDKSTRLYQQRRYANQEVKIYTSRVKSLLDDLNKKILDKPITEEEIRLL